MPASVQHQHRLSELVIFAPEHLQRLENACTVVNADHAVNCVVCLWWRDIVVAV